MPVGKLIDKVMRAYIPFLLVLGLLFVTHAFAAFPRYARHLK